MKKQKFESGFNSEVVEDFGQLSQCLECECAYEETALINNERYCQECVSIEFPNETAKFEKTDLKLSCPVTDNKCGAKNLSCDQFMVGTCCKNAPYCKQDTGNYQNYVSLDKIHDQSTDAEHDAEIKCESAEMKIETCRQNLEEAKKALELAEKESNDAQIELNEKKKWRRTVQKRTLYLATIAMKEDDSDLENEPDQTAGARNQTDRVSETCKVETENSAKENRQKA